MKPDIFLVIYKNRESESDGKISGMANNWTREQLIVAFNLYCKIPFAKAVQTNPEVIRVASIIGRSPGAVAFKLGNFGSFDSE